MSRLGGQHANGPLADACSAVVIYHPFNIVTHHFKLFLELLKNGLLRDKLLPGEFE